MITVKWALSSLFGSIKTATCSRVYRQLVFIIPLTFALFGCGGGDGEGASSEKASINIGADIVADEKAPFTLTSVVSPTGGTVRWSVSKGDAIAGLPGTGETLTLETPDVKQDSIFEIKGEYSAPDGSIVADYLSLSVTSINQIPEVVLTQTFPEELPSKWNDTIVISAEESVDPDENGQIVAYQWQQTAGVPIVVSALNESTLQFIHPLLASSAAVTWQVTVTDDEGASASNSISLILGKNDRLVFANAGDDFAATEYESVVIDGSASFSVSGEYRCDWLLTSGPAVSPSQSNTCTLNFVAPDVDQVQTLEWLLTITDKAGYVGTDSIVVTIEPTKLGYLNDSGQTSCYTSTTSVECTNVNALAGQDALTGRDSVTARIKKTGHGDGGFDFTKLNEFADELPNSATSFSCVRDNVTGLIWEVKELPIGSIPAVTTRAAHNQFTWGFDGRVGSVFGAAQSSCSSVTNCALQTYIQAVNATNYCGGSNWRMPSYNELLGLLDFEKTQGGVLLPQQYFPNLPAKSLNGHLYFWTAQTSADGTSLSQAFVIDLATGNDLAYPKANVAYVMLVRTP